MSDVGYPQWYQDATGVVLEFCSPTNQGELDGGYCLLLPGDTTVPESFPDRFADEHFYWAADAVGNWSFNGVPGARAALVLGLEAAFAVGPVRAGDQIVFGRLRIRVDDLPASGTYTVYTPFGKYAFPGQAAGDRLFFTEDIGINCLPGDFTCALQSSVGPFLLPSDTPGGAEIAPVTGPAPGKLYIADPGRSGPVTGSPLPDWVLADGTSRNPNVFLVEAPDGQVIFETHDFAIMGRLFAGQIPGRVAADRSSYSRSASSQQIDTFATAFPTRQARVPASPIIAPELPQLALYSVPCAGTLAEDGTLHPPFGSPGTPPVTMSRSGSAYFVQTRPAAIPTHVCLEHSNARDTSGNIVPAFFNVPVADKVNITEATYDPDARTLKVVASSADLVDLPQLWVGEWGGGAVPRTDFPVGAGEVVIADVDAPPHTVHVHSVANGFNSMQVTSVAGTGAANGSPVANADTADALSNVALAIDVLANDADPDGDALRVIAVSQPANGTAVNGGTGVTYTANPGYAGPDAFTYTITDDRGGFATGNVFVSVNVAANEPPVANPDSAITNFDVPVTLQVLVNDSDPNGDPMSVVAVSQPVNGEGAVTFTGSSVTFTPTPGFFGSAAFTYSVADTRGGQTDGAVTVTVRAQETIAFTRAEYRTSAPAQYRLDGTGSVIGSTLTLSLVRGGVDLGVIATTSVDAAGAWTLRSPAPPGLVPVTGDRIRATSSLGTVREQNLTVRR
jgi:hypothetical protein